MRRRVLLGACLAASALGPVALASGPPEPIDLLSPAPTPGNLGHWRFFSEDPKATFADTWRVEQGVLISKGTPLGYLYTDKKYADFTLKLQYRVPEDAKPHKGGVLFRVTGQHKIWPKSLEAQINHPDAGDFWGLDGYTLDGPADRKKQLAHDQFGLLTNLKKARDAAKPLGQWNDYEVRAEGGTVTLLLNGQEVNRATGCETSAGPIVLTAEGNEIHFRNIRLTPRD